MRIYIYYLIDANDGLPFYVGASKNTKGRYKEHKRRFKRTRGDVILQVHKFVLSWQKAKEEERKLILKYKKIYGSKIINKTNNTIPHRSWGWNEERMLYKPRVDWVILTTSDKDALFTNLPRVGYYKIATMCDYCPETIRGLFKKKPNKITKELHTSILKYKELMKKAPK